MITMGDLVTVGEWGAKRDGGVEEGSLTSALRSRVFEGEGFGVGRTCRDMDALAGQKH